MSGTGATVLVAADDEAVREACVAPLRDGYEVLTVESAAAAETAAAEADLDVALVATRLPDGSPRSLVARLRDRASVPRVALLAPEPREVPDPGPFDAALAVPPSPADLESTVDRLAACKRYDDRIGRFYALSVACADLARRLDRAELEDSVAYARLRAEREAAREAADEALSEVSREDRPALVPRDGGPSASPGTDTHWRTYHEIHD